MPSKNPEVWRRAARKYKKSHPDRVRADQARWYANNRDKKLASTRRANDRRKYGDPAIREKLFALQNGRCASCGSSDPANKKGWHVDHCHGSGRVRGLLCHPCNTALGLMRENPVALRALADYAEKCNG